jgi:hypothetical protein
MWSDVVSGGVESEQLEEMRCSRCMEGEGGTRESVVLVRALVLAPLLPPHPPPPPPRKARSGRLALRLRVLCVGGLGWIAHTVVTVVLLVAKVHLAIAEETHERVEPAPERRLLPRRAPHVPLAHSRCAVPCLLQLVRHECHAREDALALVGTDGALLQTRANGVTSCAFAVRCRAKIFFVSEPPRIAVVQGVWLSVYSVGCCCICGMQVYNVHGSVCLGS